MQAPRLDTRPKQLPYEPLEKPQLNKKRLMEHPHCDSHNNAAQQVSFAA